MKKYWYNERLLTEKELKEAKAEAEKQAKAEQKAREEAEKQAAEGEQK